MRADRIKANGVHYTPPALAEFLANVTAEAIGPIERTTEILDPACGDGALLLALARCLPSDARRRVVLHGYETDGQALRIAQRSLADLDVKGIHLAEQDFLSLQGVDARRGARQLSLLDQEEADGISIARFDAVIANPPYVRTQVLGAAKAQELARRFGLTGRVDLYHAFTRAMANVLNPGGVLALLTSNRFLTVRSGAALRRLLRTEFDLTAIFDLGDTRLFSAAVLPAIVVARRQRQSPSGKCRFDRIYECRSLAPGTRPGPRYPTVLEAFREREASGIIATDAGLFRIERGVLSAADNDETWSLSTPEYERWLKAIRGKQRCTFEHVAHVRVGIKTTADEVFIRSDWRCLPPEVRPEEGLLHPLVTDLDASRWIPARLCAPQRVLYPHAIVSGKRVAVDLEAYPGARRYLESYRERLSRRAYVIEAGRKWYEIWVPHSPSDWQKPKVVFPDIAEEPRFFLDLSGSVVNGDCYWITLRPGFNLEWLYLILAVANSSFVTKYYDVAFHNKLYAGRRRFMTQYVRMFPLPDLSAALSQEIVGLVSQLVADRQVDKELEERIDGLVWESFGLGKEVGG